MCSKVTHRTLILGYSTLWFIINCNTYFRMMPFFCIRISQGSVATCLKNGGIFKHEFVANLLLSRLVKKKFENRIIVSEVMAKSLVSCFFYSRCIYVYIQNIYPLFGNIVYVTNTSNVQFQSWLNDTLWNKQINSTCYFIAQQFYQLTNYFQHTKRKLRIFSTLRYVNAYGVTMVTSVNR